MRRPFILFQAALGLNYCTNDVQDVAGPIDSCTCGVSNIPLVHLASIKGDVALLTKIRDEQACDLTVKSATGNNALFFAAQSAKPLETSRFLIKNGVDKSQGNRNGITPMHALLSEGSNANNLEEVLHTINEYRYHGMASDAVSRPVMYLTVIPNVLQITIPNYLVSYSPSDYLQRNDKFSDREKAKIMTSLQTPFENVVSTVSKRTRDELLASFEVKRKHEMDKRQRDLDELREEFDQKNIEFDGQANELKNNLLESKRMHQDAQAQIQELKVEFMAEVQRHQDSENSLQNQLETIRIETESSDRITNILKNEHEKEIITIKSDHESLLMQIKYDSDARETEYQSRISESNTKIENYIGQLADENTKNDEKEKIVSEAAAHIKTLQHDLEELHLNKELRTEFNTQNSKCSACEETVTALEETNTELDSKFSSLFIESEALRSENNENNQKILELSADLTLKVSGLAACLTQLQESEGERNALQLKLKISEDSKVTADIVEADIVKADIVEADIVEADIVEADIAEADIAEADNVETSNETAD